MAIAKRPTVNPDPSEEETQLKKFINAAPDGDKKSPKPRAAEEKRYGRWKLKAGKVVITHTLDPETLQKLDDLAEETGVKRAALINMLIHRALSAADITR